MEKKMTEQQQEEKIVLNGKEYLFDSLNDNQKYFVRQVRALQERELSIKFDLDQVILAKQSFSDLLVKSLEESAEESAEEITQE